MKQKFIIIIIYCLIFISLFLVFFLFFYNPRKNLKVDFLDVGLGSSIVIQTPYDQNILIDGGDSDAKILRQLPKFMPFYDKTIDLVILTHPHDDHVGGLVKVLKRYKVEKILYTGVVHTSPAYLEFLKIIKDKHIPLVIIDRPQNIVLGENLNLKVLYPFTSFLNKEVENLNNTSIVAMLVYKDNKFLFTGDMEKEVEEVFVKQKPDIQADVMLAGHHGSDTSSSEDFLQLVKPAYALIQSGADNEFGHPSLRVLRRFDSMKILYLRNDLSGWVQFISDGKDLFYFLAKQ